MSIDYFDAIQAAIFLAAAGLVVLALYRAIEFRRVMVGRAYKSRANWTVVFLLAILFFYVDSQGALPYLSSDGGVPGWIVITISLVLFVDSNVRATQETDFFHRDTLRWRVFGRPAVMAMLCSLAIIGLAIVALGFANIATWGLTSTSPVWVAVGVFQYFAVLGVVLAYGAASVITAGRRTQDRTMKRFVGMLGLSLLGFVLFFTTWIPLAFFGTDASDVGSELFLIVAGYYLYKAVMSFSPVGRVEISTGSVPPVSVGVLPSSPGAP